MDAGIRASRSYVLVEPDYRRCILCGVVWNIGLDWCPPWLRSEAEDRMLAALARIELAGRKSA